MFFTKKTKETKKMLMHVLNKKVKTVHVDGDRESAAGYIESPLLDYIKHDQNKTKNYDLKAKLYNF